MKKINLNTPILDLAGKPIEGISESIGQTVASVIANFTNTDALKKQGVNVETLKIYEWAKTLYTNKELSLDSSDFEVFKSLVEHTPQLSPLVRGQVREILNKLKD
ncbi:MAG: S49 family peptidase [Bacteroidetes bacterium]|nr:S49 family peptidase [Bacteroidota bacterium]